MAFQSSLSVRIFKKSVKPLLAILAIIAVINPTFLQSEKLATAQFKSETMSLTSVIEIPEKQKYSLFLSPDKFESSLAHKDWLFRDDSLKTRIVFMPFDRTQKPIDYTTVITSPNRGLGSVEGLQAVAGLEVPAGKYKLYMTSKADSSPPVPTTVHLYMQPEGGLFVRLQSLFEMVNGLLSVFLGIVLSSMVTGKIREIIGLD